MVAEERTDQILTILRKEKRASVNHLASCLYVSQVTIRRELRKMEELGLISRDYGYATLRDSENRLVPLIVRDQSVPSIKDLIARKAASIIANGSTIFMDASSTVMRVVNHMREGQDVTVITNCLRTAMLLAEKNIAVYCTGGRILPSCYASTGVFSESMIRSINADMVFFSSQGITQDGNISDFSEAETFQRQLMLKHSKKRYFLCDSSKLGKSFLFTVCNAHEIDGIFSDVDIPEWLSKESPKE